MLPNAKYRATQMIGIGKKTLSFSPATPDPLPLRGFFVFTLTYTVHSHINRPVHIHACPYTRANLSLVSLRCVTKPSKESKNDYDFGW